VTQHLGRARQIPRIFFFMSSCLYTTNSRWSEPD